MNSARQIIYSMIALVITLVWFEMTPADMWVQQLLYDASDKSWLLNEPGKVLNFLFYDGVKQVLVLFAIGILISLVFFRRSNVVKHYHRGLRIVLLSMIIVPSTVSMLKAETNVACPRSLSDFGGTIPYVKVFSRYPDNMRPTEAQKCFPAGHASGGFALMSLFFLFHTPRNRKRALFFSISLGWLMGGYKMLIGDHFLSHTVVTMLLSWLLINVIVLCDSYFSSYTTMHFRRKKNAGSRPPE